MGKIVSSLVRTIPMLERDPWGRMLVKDGVRVRVCASPIPVRVAPGPGPCRRMLAAELACASRLCDSWFSCAILRPPPGAAYASNWYRVTCCDVLPRGDQHTW